MHEQHPVFTPPTNQEISIWRYMDLPKLAALLTTSSLWFSRADLLGDPHEGAYGRFNHDNRRRAYEKDWEEYGEESFEKFLKGAPVAAKRMVQRMHVSCWHMNEEESVAMWRAYAGSGQAVAVRSTYRRLCEAIVDDTTVWIGTVNYVDPTTTWIPEGNAFYPFVHKRQSFGYERELRGVVMQPLAAVDEQGRGVEMPPVDGMSVKVNLSHLVRAVYVGPQQPRWFREVVEGVTAAFEPDIEVRQSDLDSDPVY